MLLTIMTFASLVFNNFHKLRQCHKTKFQMEIASWEADLQAKEFC